MVFSSPQKSGRLILSPQKKGGEEMIKLFIYRVFNPILVSLAIKILSWEPPRQKPNPVREKVARKLTTPKALPDSLPPVEKPKVHYQQILDEHAQKSTPIKPVKHRKPISRDIVCPECSAPYTFIYSNATVSTPSKPGKVQKYKCKCCEHQWFPTEHRKRPTWLCPYCSHRIDMKVRRKDFDKFKCINPECGYRQKTGQRYTYRDYSICLDTVQQNVSYAPQIPKVKLSASHFSSTSIAFALFFFISFPLSSREVASILSGVFGLSVSHQSIINWAYAMAYYFYPLLDALPVHLSNIWVVDETYLLYEGKWGYLFTVLDGEHGSILAQMFSPTRSVAPAFAVLEKASRRFNLATSGPIDIITDGLGSYPPAIQLLASQTKGLFRHRKVIGLKDGEVKNQYRKYKNLIENYYSVLKPYYYRTRGFGSFQGAVVFSVLFTLYYNYLHPSGRCGKVELPKNP
jgi:transposase-like protein/DNA-directed RNA polymerase subunit RPC12/RpoP